MWLQDFKDRVHPYVGIVRHPQDPLGDSKMAQSQNKSNITLVIAFNRHETLIKKKQLWMYNFYNPNWKIFL